MSIIVCSPTGDEAGLQGLRSTKVEFVNWDHPIWLNFSAYVMLEEYQAKRIFASPIWQVYVTRGDEIEMP